jgi:hypothetical protein
MTTRLKKYKLNFFTETIAAMIEATSDGTVSTHAPIVSKFTSAASQLTIDVGYQQPAGLSANDGIATHPP